MAIYITNIRSMHMYNAELNYAIMRSFRPTSGVTQVATLSPSWDLFKKYRELSSRGEWNVETFNKVYVPQFIKEMQTSEAQMILHEIVRRSNVGLSIALGCVCINEEMCHRSIVSGILQGIGCEVITETGNNYEKYYEMWGMK